MSGTNSGPGDSLTTLKNLVVAVNTLGQYVNGVFNYLRGAVLFSGSAVTAGHSLLYTVPSGQQMAVVDIEICNTAAGAATFYISLVPSGGTAGASNALFYATTIAANTTTQWTGQQVLMAGGSVQAYASATTVTFLVTGGPG